MKLEAKIVFAIALVLGAPMLVGWCASPAHASLSVVSVLDRE